MVLAGFYNLLEFTLFRRKLCNNIHVIVTRDVFSGSSSKGFRKILNFDAKIPKVFSTTTRDEESVLLNTRLGVPGLWSPGYGFIICVKSESAVSQKKKHTEPLLLKLAKGLLVEN